MCHKSGKRTSRRCFKLVGVEFFLHFVHFYVVGALSALHRPQEQHTDEPGKLKFKGAVRVWVEGGGEGEAVAAVS